MNEVPDRNRLSAKLYLSFVESHQETAYMALLARKVVLKSRTVAVEYTARAPPLAPVEEVATVLFSKVELIVFSLP